MKIHLIDNSKQYIRYIIHYNSQKYRLKKKTIEIFPYDTFIYKIIKIMQNQIVFNLDIQVYKKANQKISKDFLIQNNEIIQNKVNTIIIK